MRSMMAHTNMHDLFIKCKFYVSQKDGNFVVHMFVGSFKAPILNCTTSAAWWSANIRLGYKWIYCYAVVLVITRPIYEYLSV